MTHPSIDKHRLTVLCAATMVLAAACNQEPSVKPAEIAQIRQEIADLRAELRSRTGQPPPAKVDPNSRNPFHVPDVPNPDGADVKQFAPTVNSLGKGDDPNAEQWVAASRSIPRPVDPSTIEGAWVGRWNTNGGNWVPPYEAEVRTARDRVYILYRDHQGRFLADLHRESDLLVGRLVGIENPADTSLCVVRVVGNDRLDGVWDAMSGGRKGRLDFRRRFQ
jgi:hypothetical protein